MTSRLFIALKLPGDIRREVDELRRQVSPGFNPRKWESEDKLHLTLKFLGDTEEKLVPEIEGMLGEIVQKFSPFRCSYEKFGFFLPRILYLGLRAEKGLFQAANEINDRFESLGFRKELRNFKAHITLLRIKETPDEKVISAYTDFRLPKREFLLDEVSVMKSRLLPGGSVYSEVRKFNLI